MFVNGVLIKYLESNTLNRPQSSFSGMQVFPHTQRDKLPLQGMQRPERASVRWSDAKVIAVPDDDR